MALFHVTWENVSTGEFSSRERMTAYVREGVVPSLQMFAKWADEGKIKGGALAGGRAGACFIEAESAEQIDEMLMQLPFWGQMKWTVTPLVSFRDKATHAQQMLEYFERGSWR